jgi:hypothetical protein
MPRLFAFASRRAHTAHHLLAAGAFAALLAPAAAQAQVSEQSDPTVSLHLRGTYLGKGRQNGVTAGVQVRGASATYVLGGLDVMAFRLGSGSVFQGEPGTQIHLVPLSPPRLTLGLGHRGAMGDGMTVRGEAYVGQQGVIDGFQPLAGAALTVGREPWAVTVDGLLRRAATLEVQEQPSPSYPAVTRLNGHTWVPTVEVGARWDVGSLGRSAAARPGGPRGDRLERPMLGGLAGGVLGAGAGMLVGLVAMVGCQGDESCLAPMFMGTAVGATVGVPVGVHVAEHHRGNVYLSTAASIGIGALGLATTRYTGDSGAAGQSIAVLVPLTQIVAATFIERHTARRH